MSRSTNGGDYREMTHYAVYQRVKSAMKAWRTARGLTQIDMASILSIPAKNYGIYETHPKRSVPLWIIVRFCLIADVDANCLLLGRQPAEPPHLFGDPGPPKNRRRKPLTL